MDEMYRKISGGLKSSIDAHGAIDKTMISSATKRIYGLLKPLMEKGKMNACGEMGALERKLDGKQEKIQVLQRANQTLTQANRNLVNNLTALRISMGEEDE